MISQGFVGNLGGMNSTPQSSVRASPEVPRARSEAQAYTLLTTPFERQRAEHELPKAPSTAL